MRIQRYWWPPVADPRSRGFPLGLAGVCAAAAVWAFMAWSSASELFFGCCCASFALVAAMRPSQRLRSTRRGDGALVLDLPPRYRLGTAAFLVGPLLAMFVARWAGPGTRPGWAEVVLWLALAIALALLGVHLTGERFRVSDEALERGRWSVWTIRLSWSAIRTLEYTCTEAGDSGPAVSGFRVEGRAPTTHCCVLFVPEHLDGIGDFAGAALRLVPRDVLQGCAPASVARLRELAG